MRVLKDIFYSDERIAEKSLDLYIPTGECKAVLFYMHGGGIEAGEKHHQEREGAYLAERGYGFISINYRMYPSAKYPEFICDSAEAVAWAVKNINEYFGCGKLYVSGSSAGGYLSMMLCFDKRYYEAVGISNADISGYLHDAGQPTAHFNVLKYSGIDYRRVIADERAPIYYIGLEDEYPPMRFIVSDNDMKGRYEQTMLTLNTLEHFGYRHFDHRVMHGGHCQYCHDVDENGVPVLAHIMEDFLCEIEKI